jgi:ATP-dependent Clp protease adapter protein ClpS
MTEVQAPDTVTQGQDDSDVLILSPAKVILYNDEVHTFDDVIGQLIKATGCSATQAEAWAWEVHTKGKANVFEGTMTECLRVSAVLEEIALHTQIEV